jgi:hypothetical protein
MSIETEYDPEYVGLEDVPISGPDTYSVEEKRKALFHAETSLELDVNGGQEIPQVEVIDAHRSAIMNLATHVLTHAAEENSDVTLGDMQSGGGNITEYSSRYLEEYNRLVQKINQSGAGSSDYGNFSMAVNTGLDDE